jgi:hypothetical protein
MLILRASALAHHEAAAYDTQKVMTITGTVSNFQFVNLYVIIAIEISVRDHRDRDQGCVGQDRLVERTDEP